eukprot:ctg_1480.g363
MSRSACGRRWQRPTPIPTFWTRRAGIHAGPPAGGECARRRRLRGAVDTTGSAAATGSAGRTATLSMTCLARVCAAGTARWCWSQWVGVDMGGGPRSVNPGGPQAMLTAEDFGWPMRKPPFVGCTSARLRASTVDCGLISGDGRAKKSVAAVASPSSHSTCSRASAARHCASNAACTASAPGASSPNSLTGRWRLARHNGARKSADRAAAVSASQCIDGSMARAACTDRRSRKRGVDARSSPSLHNRRQSSGSASGVASEQRRLRQPRADGCRTPPVRRVAATASSSLPTVAGLLDALRW